MDEITETLHCNLDLIEARKAPSKRIPAGHQNDALAKLHKWFESKPKPKGGILVLPTGGGKTFVAVRFLCSGPLSKGYKVLWLAHTHHLLEQAYYSFLPRNWDQAESQGYEIAMIAEPRHSLSVRVVSGTPGHFPISQISTDDDVVIATLQTIIRGYDDPRERRLKDFLDSSQGKLAVVFDEAHHSPAPSYRRFISNLQDRYDDVCVLGLTATPTHSDERKRGWLVKLFPQNIIYEVSPNTLMAAKILAKPVHEEPITKFTPEFDEREFQKWVNTFRDIPENIIDQLARSRERNAFIVQTYIDNKERYGKTLIFADRWYQCEQMREMLITRGVHADVVYSHVDGGGGSVEERNRRAKDENARVIAAFRENEIDVLINVRMLTEGTDVPDVRSVFLTRQTTSRILLTQMVGRALRGPRFGGTENAYIVSFIDNWKHLINWAGYDQIHAPGPDDAPIEYGKRPPLQWISIDLVRRLARQLDSGLNIAPTAFLEMVPIGWYRVEFLSVIADTEETETVLHLVLVFNTQKESYEQLISHLLNIDLEPFSGEMINRELCVPKVESWISMYFGEQTIEDDENMRRCLTFIARHIAQNERTPPQFFPFLERDNHDLDRLATKFSFEDKLWVGALDQSLQHEYQRSDRYWKTIYYNYSLFKSQYDSVVNRLLQLNSMTQQNPPLRVKRGSDGIIPKEPSQEVKNQVFSRDHYRCLCCGEDSTRLLHIDHIAPSYYGRNHSLDNLQTLCRTCNTTKALNELNFRATTTLLESPPSSLPAFAYPKDARDQFEWEKYVKRNLNFFFRCAAIDKATIGKRGTYFYEWDVYLFSGNDPRWLKPHLKIFVDAINRVRIDGGAIPIEGMRVRAPGIKDIIVSASKR